MKVYHNTDSILHAPEFYFRRGRNIPHFEQAQRYVVLRDAARRAGHELIAVRSAGVDAARRVHSDRYLEFLETAWARRGEIEDGIDYILPSHFARREMHRYPDGLIGRVGFHMADLSAPLYEHTYKAAVGSLSAAISAAEAVETGGYAYGLCRPPGHHASTESTGGFCFLNNSASAAAHLQAKQECKVAVIDIDVHHGNGTQIIFYARGDVVTASVHADPSTFMPYYAGYADETGSGNGKGCNLNLPLKHGSGDDVYLGAIDKAVAFCSGHGVGALVIALGLDASEDDPNGALKVTTEGFRKAGAGLAGMRLPTAIIQEGGYLSDALGVNLVAFFAGFETGYTGKPPAR